MTHHVDHLDRIKATMETVAASLKLPEYYRNDLAMDFDSLNRFNGTKLVWLLRTCGTVLVPAKLGVDPGYITHWLWGNHGQEVVPFIVDTQTGIVEKTTFEKAEKLIMEQPCNLSSAMPREALIEQVNAVLERGCEQRIWGVFESPNSVPAVGGWSEWQAYFSSTGNRLMADFLGRAIRFANIGTGAKAS
ncbi:hypothetical protein [Marinobacterium aestuariivivens]|uniref:Uncharacterized protein n=1 Tax=Marinobacterium aestuariivivens TaxID=1698799 RepID=A0ABW2AA40_9GAMM